MSTVPGKSASSRLNASHLGIALLFALFWAALGSLVLDAAKTHDFLNLYVGAKLAGEGRFSELHDPDVQFALERQLAPANTELVPFVRPHFYAALLSPLSLFSFDAALVVWLSLHASLLLAIWFWGARTFGPDAMVLGSMFLPASLGIAHGQDSVFMLALVAASWTLANKGREGAAGAVLALGLAKFHLLLCVPLALLFARRWLFLRGFTITGAALALISVALGGWTGAEKYVALLQMKDLNRLSPSPDLMINLHSIGVNFDIGGVWFSGVMVCLSLALLALATWKAPLESVFPAMLVASVLVPPHVYGYDATLLLPALWIGCFVSQSRLIKMTSTLLATPLVYFATLAGPPWSAVTGLALLSLLIALAAERVAKAVPAVSAEPTAAA